MKKVLVAVDLSAATVQVCNVARDLAQSLGARLVILHLVPPVPVAMEYYAFSTLDLTRVPSAAKKRAAEKLRALGHWFEKRIPNVRVIQHDGPPVPGILRTITATRPDFVVLGSHGHTAAFDLLIGGVAHGVMRKCPVPVVLVPVRPRPARARPPRPHAAIASDAFTMTH